MTKITVLDQSEAEIPGPEGEPITATYMTLRDEEGRIALVTVLKKDPSDAEIAEAYRKQLEERAAVKTREIEL